MSAKFKCNYTGQVYVFTSEGDITDMKRHPEYTEVVEEVKPVVVVQKPAAKKEQ